MIKHKPLNEFLLDHYSSVTLVLYAYLRICCSNTYSFFYRLHRVRKHLLKFEPDLVPRTALTRVVAYRLRSG